MCPRASFEDGRNYSLLAGEKKLVPKRGMADVQEAMRLFKNQPEIYAQWFRQLVWLASISEIQRELARGKRVGEWVMPAGSGLPRRADGSQSLINSETRENDVLAVRNNRIVFEHSGNPLFPVDTSAWHVYDEKPWFLRNEFVESSSGSWSLGFISRMDGQLGDMQIIISNKDGAVPGTLVAKLAELTSAGGALGEAARHTFIDATANSYQTHASFERLAKHLLPKLGGTLYRPVVLLMDNAPAHVNNRGASGVASRCHVAIGTEPSAASHQLQSLDMGPNAVAQGYLDQEIRVWRATSGQGSPRISDADRLEVAIKAYSRLSKASSLLRKSWYRAGWKTGTLSPRTIFTVDRFDSGGGFRPDFAPHVTPALLTSLFSPHNLICAVGSPHVLAEHQQQRAVPPVRSIRPSPSPSASASSASSSSSSASSVSVAATPSRRRSSQRLRTLSNPSASIPNSSTPRRTSHGSSSSTSTASTATPITTSTPTTARRLPPLSLTGYVLRRTPRTKVGSSTRLLAYGNAGETAEFIERYNAMIEAGEDGSEADPTAQTESDTYTAPERFATFLGGPLTSDKSLALADAATRKRQEKQAQKVAAEQERQVQAVREAPLRRALVAQLNPNTNNAIWDGSKRFSIKHLRTFIKIKVPSARISHLKRAELVTLALQHCSSSSST
jgi:hypothetical protein